LSRSNPTADRFPWHNQDQEEVYIILEGSGEMCLGEERRDICGGQAVYIPADGFSSTYQHRHVHR
jgi:mannose-6-phosphate isomerase-like protein (cupin superfamily)